MQKLAELSVFFPFWNEEENITSVVEKALEVVPQVSDLFEIIISASYGTWTHAIKGNVDILVALVMHTGAVIGAQIGVIATQYFAGPKIRLAFVPLPLIGAAIVIYTLVTGHKL